MKKKLISLILTLAVCLSLTVPALAAFHDLEVQFPDGDYTNENSGDGWSFNDDGVLTLNGAKDIRIAIGASPTIVLAPGSKNVLFGLMGGDSEYTNDITIKGTGELIIYNPNPDEFTQENGVFGGLITSLKLEDGLVMTGGTKEGDSGELTYKETADPVNGMKTRIYMAGSEMATYIRIAPAVTSITGFSDVAAGSAFEPAIKWAVDQKITNGITATTFGPGNTCTVSHILTFLWRADGQPGDSLNDWANSKGIDPGNLSAPCTRAMAVQFMWIAAGCPAPKSKANFSDVPANAAYLNAMSWAVEKGITNGTSQTTFGPGNLCTRGQIVTFLYRAQ